MLLNILLGCEFFSEVGGLLAPPCTSHCWTEKQNFFVSSFLHVTSSHCDASLCCSKNKRIACLIPYWLADPVPNVSFKSWRRNLFELLIFLDNSVYSWTVNSCSSNWNQQKRHCSCSDVARFTLILLLLLLSCYSGTLLHIKGVL